MLFTNLLSKNKLIIFILLLLAIPGIGAFFHSGYFPSHDGEWMVIRLSDFHRSLVDGQWPVRWAGRLNFGFGYPVFNFLYPGTFYLTEIFHLLRLNFVDSIKAMFAASFVMSGVFMYLFLKEWVGEWGGLAAAILYMYTPYRFVDMYVRGSLGESVAFIFPSLIFLAIVKIRDNTFVIASPERSEGRGNLFNRLLRRFTYSVNAPRNDNLFWIDIGAIGIAGLVTTHNVIAYLFLPIIVIFMILVIFLSKGNNKKILTTYYLLLTSLGLCASMFFWLPALWDKQYTIFDQVVVADFAKNFPSLRELIFPSWGYGPSNPGINGSMSFQIGIVNLLIVTSSLIMIVIRDDKRNLAIATFFSTITLVSIFFMTTYSKLFWNLVPGLSLIQFPWRILSVTTFTSAVLAGILVKNISNNKNMQILLAILTVALTVFLNLSYVKPREFVNRGEGYYTTNDDTTTVRSEYLPRWAKNLPRTRANSKVEILQGNGVVKGLTHKSNRSKFTYTGSSSLMRINTVYFPGWEAVVNGQKQDIIIDKQGLIDLKLKEGESQVAVAFNETPIRLFSDAVSLISILGIAIFLLI